MSYRISLSEGVASVVSSRQRIGYYSFTTDRTDWTDSCPMAIKQIKKFVAFPGLTPLQPDAYAHPCKRASLSDHPHPSGLPAGRRKASKQNSCPWQYKMSLRRRLLTVTSDLQGASPPGEGYCCGSRGAFFYCQRQLFCFLGLSRSCKAGLGVAA